MKSKILIVFVALALLSCSKNGDKKAQLEKLKQDRDKISAQIAALELELKDSTKNDGNKTIAITPIELQEFNHYVEVQGKIDGDENVMVLAKVPGTITKIYVKEGDFVKKGQVLAELDAQVLQQTLVELKTSLAFITDLYEKQKSLWEQNIGSEVQYLSAKNNKESLEQKLKTLGEQLDMYKITSPIDGNVEEIQAKVGLSTAMPTLVPFRVVNFAKVKVQADVAESFSSKIKTGNNVIVKLPDLNKEIIANVSFASKFINPINRTFQVEVGLKPDGTEYRANMIAVVKINDYNSKNAIVIPVSMVQNSTEGSCVYIAVKVKDKLVAKKSIVSTGMTCNGLVEITNGLSKGDQLISTGYQNLVDGQEIKL
ncbi:MAG: efflux RND transporter periplasmic adaptor subunit [Bacteroidota bacterium]